MVPYITSWSGERPTRTPIVAKGRWGIAYQRERPGDRDSHGVLWTRYVRAPGKGVPSFSRVHPIRQRQAMRLLLCQVCGGPADRNEQGILWLLDDARYAWSGQEPTGHPPVCLRCAVPARHACPYLRRLGSLALRVRRAPIVGVYGTLFRPGSDGPVAVDAAMLSYGDPRVRWLQANQLMRRLLDCTVVELER